MLNSSRRILTAHRKSLSFPTFSFSVPNLNDKARQPMRPTYRPSKIKRARKFGFRARMATKAGRAIIRARRKKGRKQLAA